MNEMTSTQRWHMSNLRPSALIQNSIDRRARCQNIYTFSRIMDIKDQSTIHVNKSSIYIGFWRANNNTHLPHDTASRSFNCNRITYFYLVSLDDFFPDFVNCVFLPENWLLNERQNAAQYQCIYMCVIVYI